jgi:hemoglobin/transferrin/lactoferrin receptor protein
MKRLCLLWLIPWWVFCAFAQVITIKDQESGEVLEHVIILSENPGAFVSTNASGQAEISVFKGSEHIEFHRVGYKTQMTSYAKIESALFEILLSPSLFNISEVVVSATRWNQKGSDIPSKIETISANEVIFQNPQTAADLLNISGKVFIQKSQQGGGSPMIRGFATNRLLYTVDGVRMNTAIFRGGNIQNVISLDPFATENTEVFFGPGSVIYGSDAIGGVMGFQTLTPQLSFSGQTLVTGSAATRYSVANNEKTSHFDINIGSEKWASLSSFSSNDFGDLRMGSNGPSEYLRPLYVQRQDDKDVVISNDDPRIQRPSGYSQINMMQKLRFKVNEKWDFQYGFHYSETSEYARYDRHIRYKKGLPRYGEWSYGPQKWMMNNLNIFHNGNAPLYDQLTIRLAQQFFEESRISRNINDPKRQIRKEQVDAYSVNLDFTKTVDKNHKLFYGMEIVQNNVTSTGTDENIFDGTSATGPSRYPQAIWASYGLFVSDQYKISDKTSLQAGMRYNRFTIEADFDTTFYPLPFTSANLNNGALTGSLGFIYRPTEQWVVKANLSTAFRSPNVDDIGKVFDSEPGSVVIPNPDLEAEYAYNADLGIAKVFGNVIRVDLTGYYTILQNALVRRDYTLNGMDSIIYDGALSQVQAIQNAAVARVYGLQAGIEIKMESGFGFSSDFNYQKGEEELDDGTTSPSRHAAPWFGVSRFTYTANKLNLEFNAIYSGEKKFKDLPEEEKGKTEIYAVDSKGNPYSPGWYTLNFKAFYQFASHFSVSAGMENLTDRRYRPYSSGIAAPGRNFVLQLRADF